VRCAESSTFFHRLVANGVCHFWTRTRKLLIILLALSEFLPPPHVFKPPRCKFFNQGSTSHWQTITTLLQVISANTRLSKSGSVQMLESPCIFVLQELGIWSRSSTIKEQKVHLCCWIRLLILLFDGTWSVVTSIRNYYPTLRYLSTRKRCTQQQEASPSSESARNPDKSQMEGWWLEGKQDGGQVYNHFP
jgi:hypothetical protein